MFESLRSSKFSDKPPMEALEDLPKDFVGGSFSEIYNALERATYGLDGGALDEAEKKLKVFYSKYGDRIEEELTEN